MLHAMIMAGGGGTRFWPRSRKDRPKQFLTLAGDRTLLQQAAGPHRGPGAAGAHLGHHRRGYRAETASSSALPADRIIGEPCGRDTAACIGLGAALIARQDPEAVMLVMPADHVIEPVQEFRRAVQVAAADGRGASRGPHHLRHPADLSGHRLRLHPPRRRGRPIARAISVYRVAGFREKPAAELAERFVASGEYFWNSGIFVWKAATILAELRERQPDLLRRRPAHRRRLGHADQRQRLASANTKRSRRSASTTPSWKHATEVLVVQAPYRWDDVGSWLALERMHPQDADGNTVLAAALRPATRKQLRDRRRRRPADRHHRRQQPADRPGRRRHPGGRPPRGGRRQATGRAAEEERDWRNTCERRPRLLGVDYGKVRIGLAVSDPDRKIASPLATYARQGRNGTRRSFRRLVEEEAIGGWWSVCRCT